MLQCTNSRLLLLLATISSIVFDVDIPQPFPAQEKMLCHDPFKAKVPEHNLPRV